MRLACPRLKLGYYRCCEALGVGVNFMLLG